MSERQHFVSLLMITLTLIGGCGPGGGSVQDEQPIRIGYMICNSLEESKERFEPITSYLSEKTGRKFVSTYVNTFEFEDLVRDKKVDFTHSNSILYIIFAKNHGVKIVVTDLRGRHGHGDTGAIISLKGNNIKTFEDMKGKTMVFGPALAPFGYMAQYYLMLENDFDPETDLSYYAIPWGSFKHEKVIYGVLFGGYDLGAAPRIDIDQMADEGRINPDDFNIIAESQAMPYCTVGVLPHVDQDLVEEVRGLLLNMKKDETALVDGEVVKVLESAWLDGFVLVDDKEYDSIREQLKRCNMDPYREF